ncbi:DUF3168 domain-containing protein [Brevundimonas viscosa]|uniref:DUF3168 domain-containing protein n=1 Tax=Brevundimonas viscosa TaxID=871741 RepID=A0A1I6SII1_9CAUL|nr:DUF3168 domain-containing protein [Brevundimonas viscosa]SFS76729.1 Protein of unknown function [Brevundimonas viscosa]
MMHERALQKALLAHLRADPGVSALLADRQWDAAPENPEHPHLVIGRSESRPLPGEGGGVEHALTLKAVSRFRGSEEAKAIVAAIRMSLSDAALQADGVRTVDVGVRFADVWPSPAGHRTYAVMRVRAVTEDM